MLRVDKRMSEVAVVVLAAGESRGMGQRNKLLIHLDGDIILRRVSRAVMPVSTLPVTVVTGHGLVGVLCALRRESVNFVHNPFIFPDNQHPL